MVAISQLLITALLGAASVMAHGHVTGVNYKGEFVNGFQLAFAYSSNPPDVIGWSTTALDNGFVDPAKFATEDIICHSGAKNGKASLTVAAGDSFSIQWDTWPESHKGPVIDYLAKCSGACETVDKGSLEFFKIAEVGLIDRSLNSGKWGSDVLIAGDNKWNVTIPSNLAAGNYVLRHEIIALHAAGQTNGAQSYPQCINLKVTGSGSGSAAGVKGTALYKATDAGIKFDLYNKPTSYPIPGPALSALGSSGNGGNSGSSPTTTTDTQAATTAAPTTTSAAENGYGNGSGRTVTVTATVECDGSGTPLY